MASGECNFYQAQANKDLHMLYSAGRETNVVGLATISIEHAWALALGQGEQVKIFAMGKDIQ